MKDTFNKGFNLVQMQLRLATAFGKVKDDPIKFQKLCNLIRSLDKLDEVEIVNKLKDKKND